MNELASPIWTPHPHDLPGLAQRLRTWSCGNPGGMESAFRTETVHRKCRTSSLFIGSSSFPTRWPVCLFQFCKPPPTHPDLGRNTPHTWEPARAGRSPAARGGRKCGQCRGLPAARWAGAEPRERGRRAGPPPRAPRRDPAPRPRPPGDPGTAAPRAHPPAAAPSPWRPAPPAPPGPLAAPQSPRARRTHGEPGDGYRGAGDAAEPAALRPVPPGPRLAPGPHPSLCRRCPRPACPPGCSGRSSPSRRVSASRLSPSFSRN